MTWPKQQRQQKQKQKKSRSSSGSCSNNQQETANTKTNLPLPQFSLFDLDKDRHIDYHELRVSLRALGFQTPKPEALQLMQQYGVPKPLSQTPNQPRHPSTLLLSHNTFLLIAARKLLARDPREEVARAFSLFDVAGKGYIDIEDLRRVTRELGETSLSEAELEAMVEEFDYEGIPGGGVSRDAFFGICLG